MIEFCELDRRERIQLRNRTERLSELLDWAELGRAYHRAHDMALAWTCDGLPPTEDQPAPAGADS